MPDFEFLLYERPAAGVARIVLNRVAKRNASDTPFLYELNDAFDHAAQDSDVKVIILAANGPHFCAGHDIFEADADVQRVGKVHEQFRTVGTSSNFAAPGNEGYIAREEEIYIGFCERWRNIPKPTIAQVHGKCIAGGLMFAWPCDLIIASDDAQFIDNTLLMGSPGVEWFRHGREFGFRKAKELLFAAQAVSAQEAQALGMVNRVVPRERLADETLALASKIAERSSYILKLTKKMMNAAEDAQGRLAAQEAAFAYHQLAHWHNKDRFGMIVDPGYYQQYMKTKAPNAEQG
jgi:enoyl-CoA hydratase